MCGREAHEGAIFLCMAGQMSTAGGNGREQSTYLVEGMDMQIALPSARIVCEEQGRVACQPGARNVAQGVAAERIAD